MRWVNWTTIAVAVAVTPSPAHSQREAAPLPMAHAHNDYEHPRPLFDALDRGFCNVEADVFLVDGELLVGHAKEQLRPDRTLRRLYLDPLRERVRKNGGRVFRHGPVFHLLVDVKSEAKSTYATLARQLADYGDMLSVARDGRFEPKAVTVIVSGNRAREEIAAEKIRYAAIDGRRADLGSDAPTDLVPWVSESWPSLFRWNGQGTMPPEERAKLREFVWQAHLRGRLVRFWATPETADCWRTLRAARVDLIGTDRLDELQRHLLSEP